MENSYSPVLKTLFIIEGVLMYMPPSAVDSLLAFISNFSVSGSSIIADYFDTTVVEGTSPLKEAQVLRQFVRNEGSSLQFGIQLGREEAFFKQRGFHQVKCVTAQSCKEKFFHKNSRYRTVSAMFNFVYATVESQ